MDRERVRKSAELSRVMQRLEQLPEWEIFVRELKVLESELSPGLRQPITDQASTLRLTRLQGKLEMLDLILETPQQLVADAETARSALARKEKVNA